MGLDLADPGVGFQGAQLLQRGRVVNPTPLFYGFTENSCRAVCQEWVDVQGEGS